MEINVATIWYFIYGFFENEQFHLSESVRETFDFLVLILPAIFRGFEKRRRRRSDYIIRHHRSASKFIWMKERKKIKLKPHGIGTIENRESNKPKSFFWFFSFLLPLFGKRQCCIVGKNEYIAASYISAKFPFCRWLETDVGYTIKQINCKWSKQSTKPIFCFSFLSFSPFHYKWNSQRVK